MNFPSIVLASGSPRRRELLEQIGVRFSVISVDIDESVKPEESPRDYVTRLAVEKAQAGWGKLSDEQKQPVLGADTSVIVGNTILGKPKDDADARRMLMALSGQTHEVLTAVALTDGTVTMTELSQNYVTFTSLTEDDRTWYLQTQEGVDKAGGYAVQGLAAMFIEEIRGSYSGIMGLPLHEVSILLNRITKANHE
jgi:septum formation protein